MKFVNLLKIDFIVEYLKYDKNWSMKNGNFFFTRLSTDNIIQCKGKHFTGWELIHKINTLIWFYR